MIFLKTSDGDYWQWCKDTMEAINYCGGGFTIDENSDWFTSCTTYETESWHTLYCETGYIPIEQGTLDSYNAWIAPNGSIWHARAHMVDAIDIVDICYGKKLKTSGVNNAADYLHKNGWVKVTSGYMWSYYCEDTLMNWKITKATYNTLLRYCNHNKLKLPKNIEVIYEL